MRKDPLKDNVEKLKATGSPDDAKVAKAIETHQDNVKKSVKRMEKNPANKGRIKRNEENRRIAGSDKPSSEGGWF